MARAKAVGFRGVTFTHGDAASPRLAGRTYDAVISRYVLWALAAWSGLLRSGGRLVLVEGRWSTGSGLASTEIVRLLTDLGCTPLVTPLDDPRYWGGLIDDERYVVTAKAITAPLTQPRFREGDRFSGFIPLSKSGRFFDVNLSARGWCQEPMQA